MKEKTDRQVRRYLRQVWNGLPCPKREKRRILSAINETLEDYLLENPNAQYEEIQARFGPPQQIAASYIGAMETQELMKRLRTRKRILGVTLTAAALLVAMWLVYLGICFEEVEQNANGYLSEGQIVIVEEDTRQ